ncbi:MFS transporter [uncultured Thiodictyon sp.]|uniref:MFS transporter n=1 Tax=uncultured Thiodictyon sp. TaxID=1846217 RepID=UPI0025F897F1|nr:MFS transporter [uncultured Thiodictyon sp.]
MNMKENQVAADRGKKPQERIRFSQLAAYGAGGIIPIALFNAAGILVGLLGNISLGLSAFWLGAILIVPRLWDALSDPLIGHLSDNTRTRWGRRRPYLLLGGIAVAISFVAIWWIPKGDLVHRWFPSDSGYQTFQLLYILFSLLIFFTSVNIFEIPHGALGMELTTNYHELTRLFSAKSFVGNLFAMSTPWLFALANMEQFRGPGGNEVDGMRYVSLMIAALLIPLSVWWFLKLREPSFVRVSAQERTPFWHDMKRTANNRNFIMLTLGIFTLAMGFNFVSLLGSYIPIFYIFGGDKVAGATLLGINGTVWAITGLLAVFPLNWISPRLGKRNTLAIAILLMVSAQASKIVCYNPAHPYLIIIPTILLSAGMLFFFTLGSSMVGDICDEDELQTGHRSEGSFYSVFWWFIKMGTALASFVAGALIVFTLFDESQVTKVDAMQGRIGEMRSDIAYWKGAGSDGAWIEKWKKQAAEALEDSRKFKIYLENESAKELATSKEEGAATQKRQALLNYLASVKAVIAALEDVQIQLEGSAGLSNAALAKALVDKAMSLSLQVKLEKAKMASFELIAHLHAKAVGAKAVRGHYLDLLEKGTRIKGLLDFQWKHIFLETGR